MGGSKSVNDTYTGPQTVYMLPSSSCLPAIVNCKLSDDDL